MSVVRSWLYSGRRLLLGVSVSAVVVGILIGLGIAAVRWAHHVNAFVEITAIVAVGGILLAVAASALRPGLPPQTVLELDLATLPPESISSNLLARARGRPQLSMRDTVELLERAEADQRVSGIVVYATFGRSGVAQIQELRDAILALRRAGKLTVAFSDTFGELGPGNGAYYLATACEHIVLQPSGQVGLMGLAREINFVRAALDRIGVDPQFEGRHEYKSAATQLLNTGLTDPEREQLQRVLDSQFGQIIAGVVESRSLPAEDARRLAASGPLVAEEARAARLVDRLGYRDEARVLAKQRAGEGASLRFLDRYAKHARRRLGRSRRPTVAIITATGPIVRRRTAPNPLTGSDQIQADGTTEAIRQACADRKVRAIVVRVDSPGGSAVASDTIWRETVLARQAGKPLVVSMGNVAGSGGYYISAGADRIVAQPGTVTGSIGVIGGKPVLARAKERIGLNVDEAHTSSNALMWSLNRVFDDSEEERFAKSLDVIYDTFVTRVAEGRGMTKERVHEVARGRVWTGEDAHAVGLVDTLGGFRAALAEARELAGIEPGALLNTKRFPKRVSPLAAMRGARGESSDDVNERLRGALGALDALGPLGELASALGLSESRGAIHMQTDHRSWHIR